MDVRDRIGILGGGGIFGFPHYEKNEVAVVNSERHEIKIPVETVSCKRLNNIKNALKLKMIASVICVAYGVFMIVNMSVSLNDVLKHEKNVETFGTVRTIGLGDYDVIAPVYSEDWYEIQGAGINSYSTVVADTNNQSKSLNTFLLPGITYNFSEKRTINGVDTKLVEDDDTITSGSTELIIKAKADDKYVVWDEDIHKAVTVKGSTSYSIGDLISADRVVDENNQVKVYDNMELKSSFPYKNTGVTIKCLNASQYDLYFICKETGEAFRLKKSTIVDEYAAESGRELLAHRNVDSNGNVSFVID